MSEVDVSQIRQDIAVLTEMVKIFKEETYPSAIRATQNALKLIDDKISEQQKHLDATSNRIAIVENYIIEHKTELGVWKGIVSFLGISGLLALGSWLYNSIKP